MSAPRFGLALAALGLLLAEPAAALEAPALERARMDTRSAAAGLAEVVRQLSQEKGPAWIAYSVPMAGHHQMCCFSSWSGGNARCVGCRLEGGEAGFSEGPDRRRVSLEGPERLLVFLRVAAGAIGRIRVFSEGCGIDASGLAVHWLSDVEPTQSLALLAGLAPRRPEGRDDDEPGESALAAIAHHDHPKADEILAGLAAPGRSRHLRKQAAFWLGNARGKAGFEILKRLAPGDPSDDFREDAVFALSQSPVPEAIDVMIGIGKHDPSAHVRSQALFWLAQKAGQRASAAITDAIRDDPETKVKRQAVFALSQLPPEEGIPLLIKTARENRNPEVRKQAMFWLGQSGDARALDFFAQVLRP